MWHLTQNAVPRSIPPEPPQTQGRLTPNCAEEYPTERGSAPATSTPSSINLLVAQSYLFPKSVPPGGVRGDKPAAAAAGAALGDPPGPSSSHGRLRGPGTGARRPAEGGGPRLPQKATRRGGGPFTWEAGPSPPAHARPESLWRRLGIRAGKGARGLLPRGWPPLATVTCLGFTVLFWRKG